MNDLILEARGILKRYPGNIALNHVDFHLHRNAINVLIGENGAGKSTLMRVLAGVEQPDAGIITLDGKPITLRSHATLPPTESALSIKSSPSCQTSTSARTSSLAENSYAPHRLAPRSTAPKKTAAASLP